MTFREKSALASLMAIGLVYGGYVLSLGAGPLSGPQVLARMIGAIAALTAVMIVAHVAIVVEARPEKLDERDRAVMWRSARNGYVAVTLGLWAIPFLAILPVSRLFVANTALAIMMLAELVNQASRLFYYRRGLTG